MATDTQGYVSSKDGSDRSPQELTALSWASFTTELVPEEDTTFKIQALDCDDLFERLKLASGMLRAKKTDLRDKLKKAGINFKGEGFDEDDKGEGFEEGESPESELE
jgi:predicted nucleic acid-binding Zn ribbon protein